MRSSYRAAGGARERQTIDLRYAQLQNDKRNLAWVGLEVAYHVLVGNPAVPDNRPTIEEALRAFMVVCGGAPDVWERLESFITKLQSDPSWSAEEAEEVHSRIIERLTA